MNYIIISGVKEVKDLASYHDANSSTLTHQKFHIEDSDVPKFGEDLKKIYTNSTFSSDLRALIEVSRIY